MMISLSDLNSLTLSSSLVSTLYIPPFSLLSVLIMTPAVPFPSKGYKPVNRIHETYQFILLLTFLNRQSSTSLNSPRLRSNVTRTYTHSSNSSTPSRPHLLRKFFKSTLSFPYLTRQEPSLMTAQVKQIVLFKPVQISVTGVILSPTHHLLLPHFRVIFLDKKKITW